LIEIFTYIDSWGGAAAASTAGWDLAGGEGDAEAWGWEPCGAGRPG